LRVDKLTIAALEVTLRAYLHTDLREIPAQRMMRLTVEEIAERTGRFLKQLEPLIAGADAEVEIGDGTSLLGGGSTPAQSLPTKVLRLASLRYSTNQIEERLRLPDTGVPVIARIEEGRLLIDLRTVFPDQDAALVQTLAVALR